VSDASGALDTGNQVLLCKRGFGCDKYRVVAADVADHFRPFAAIERERNALCRTDGGSNDQQVRAGGADLAQQGSDFGHLPVARLIDTREFVSPGCFDSAELAKIAAYARLRGDKPLGNQGIHDELLRSGRALAQQLPYCISALCLIFA